jgi:hypothetical protein
MRFEGTPEQVALAGAVIGRVNADSALDAAKTGLWKGVTISLASLGIGASASMVILAYSVVPATKTITEQVVIHDQPAAPPAIPAQAQDRRASDRASDARPSPSQLQPQARPASKAKAVTNYTVFKTVSFQSGVVVTGWQFDDSNHQTPRQQYCYFEPSLSGSVNNYIMIGEDGHAALPKTKELRGVNLEAAASNCVWSSPDVKSASTTK